VRYPCIGYCLIDKRGYCVACGRPPTLGMPESCASGPSSEKTPPTSEKEEPTGAAGSGDTAMLRGNRA